MSQLNVVLLLHSEAFFGLCSEKGKPMIKSVKTTLSIWTLFSVTRGNPVSVYMLLVKKWVTTHICPHVGPSLGYLPYSAGMLEAKGKAGREA